MEPTLSKGEQTRVRILDVSLEVFGRKGFFESSLAEIADELGLSQTAILRHYPSKTRLFEGVIYRVLKTNHAAVSALIDSEAMGLTSLDGYLEGNLVWMKKNPDQAQMILLLYYLASFDPAFTAIYEQVLSVARARVERYVLEASRLGELELETREIRSFAHAIHELILGGLLNVVTQRKKGAAAPLEELRVKLKMLIDARAPVKTKRR